eukprot:CAMPEP_0197634488 /NCGR_PEP_ID=MMETSP1338-20131121/10568_1 /TAXON_ID=43686 ORGANISM="Pelagodinium beii, Strain RCC1491" /NCGR_SAMPLE_ID=MMETSP1338 /ASSEMBLY_ACC=CAM_ASM_000754 /LENGTH=182 /DNA_ID=CAMNT_0043206359 /DNA_START=67 /DNA_END=612 /DNA_ORIENTATION=-
MFGPSKQIPPGLARALASPKGGLFVAARDSTRNEATVAGAAGGAGGETKGQGELQSDLLTGTAGYSSQVPAGLEAANGYPSSNAERGPDPSRGFDVEEYRNIWSALSKERQWPSVQRFAVVGPAGGDFAAAVEARVAETLGRKPEQVSTEPRSRWQSVRMDVQCTSPDDFCALHSRLKSLEG